MKRIHYITIILLLSVVSLFAQKPKGYSIEGDDVVFTFHRSDYETLSHDYSGNRIDFDDLTVDNVVVAGEFNNWSKYDWKMTKIDDDTYELRKPLSKFDGNYSWQFKFIINNEYWAEPTNRDPNIVDAKNQNGKYLHVYNLKMFAKAYPSEDGNVRFRLRGFEDAEKVVVAGSFNKWDDQSFQMYRIENGWELKLQIKPGEYEYRFVVDGDWMEDPSNPDKVLNEFDEFNSRLNVGKYVTFLLKGYQDAQTVVLAGSFNDWNEEDLKMEKTENGYWYYRLPLPAGKHHYKFIVDGEWILDPDNSVREYDGNGHVNSVFMVK
ncbi:glycogen-binding domain-containing protein [Psychroserpens sp. XS_ASV72]|uniref:glycogen-binding domain-containing protein n=1 Tax=Psychroserpens sp. XS_ASV72 TaxID=3241293 RepID=UPI003514A8A0